VNPSGVVAAAATPLSKGAIVMSLKTELEQFRAEFIGKAAPETWAAMTRADLDLAASGILEKTL